MQAKIHEKFCCFVQVFDIQIDKFLQKSLISAPSFTCNRFFVIFAPSLTNIIRYEIITDQQFDQLWRELFGLVLHSNRAFLLAEPY